MQEARLVSVQVGRPRAYLVQTRPSAPARPLEGRQTGALAPRGGDGQDGGEAVPATWESGFAKAPVNRPLWLGREQLEGDGQADRKNHGGPDKAVLAYAASHYDLWRQELGRALPYGSFAENFTVDGLDEHAVCIGDVYLVGTAEVEVAQPRVPCWKIERYWGLPGLTERVRSSGRSGWYLRVRKPGWIQAGQAVHLLQRPYLEWTVARVNDLIHGRCSSISALRALLEVPPLAAAVRDQVQQRLQARTGP
ncbi:MOSC domain-containing protein [Alicyclobacillus shizuokensis]|uniref:MOSC domain-containing protein n=1 Tax=Alicyclobacillus shizuokensis TaxID=392014 RepID=UPI0008332C7C|nr:MOSC domain-containing protein [Alicyclobacillus shizuokensis]MCL6626636.1 MOSC domain-containing protein [Alicyclobacillus shizuokensis]